MFIKPFYSLVRENPLLLSMEKLVFRPFQGYYHYWHSTLQLPAVYPSTGNSREMLFATLKSSQVDIAVLITTAATYCGTK